VIPACLLPFDADLRIDEPAYRRHLRNLAGVDGVTALTVNGHAAEVHALSFDEQRRVLEITKDEVGDSVPVLAGVYADGSLEAGRLARMAEGAGADGLLIFPPQSLALGGQLRPEAAVAHWRHVTDRTGLPLILFQYPHASGLGYPLDTLLALCGRFPTIRAVKDWCNDPALHERHIRELHALDPPVHVLSTHSAWLLGSLVLGCRGILSGAGSVLANLHVALWRAVQDNDLAAARAVNDRLYPTVRAFYDPPLVDMHNRMKEALVLLGRLDAAHVRPPLVKLSPAEIDRLGRLLREAGLSRETVYAPAGTAGTRRLHVTVNPSGTESTK
jgi:4-hydroxy-tetrahydrodipicolinate synthase